MQITQGFVNLIEKYEYNLSILPRQIIQIILILYLKRIHSFSVTIISNNLHVNTFTRICL